MNAIVFYDAVGGDLTAKIMTLMPKNSFIYVYGALDGPYVKDLHIADFVGKNMTVKGLFLPVWL